MSEEGESPGFSGGGPAGNPAARRRAAAPSHGTSPGGRYLALMSLGALGVVYGDIGTSPLYAMRECFSGSHPIAANVANVLGVLSLIFWSLVVIISIKYLVFVLRADNRGEGGILALMALVRPRLAERKWTGPAVTVLGIFGAALLYGDGVLTPAISVLSAVEGLSLAAPVFRNLVLPTTIAVLVGLFLIQKRGTHRVGAIFGPFTLVWFVVLGVIGTRHILRDPSVFAAINPVHAFEFFTRNRWDGFVTLGTVFLVVTGGEALYADLGHFGKRPIRAAWFGVVLAALLLNYFGQGAFLLGNPGSAENLFFLMAPGWALYPMVVLSTLATVIASQAVISGVSSLTRQAVQLGYVPRLEISHTSAREIGQIYVPVINWALMVGCVALVIGFGSSSNLAAAYGVAVTTTMVITTLLLFAVERELWGWSLAASLAFTAAFLAVDLAFFGANMLKVTHGGWFPLVLAGAIFTVMTTWRRGRRVLADKIEREAISDELFVGSLGRRMPPRVPGTAVFMDRTRTKVPLALLHNLKHNKVLHSQVVLLSIVTEEVPYVADEEQLDARDLGHGLFRIVAHCGFLDDQDVPELLRNVSLPGFEFHPDSTTYFLGRETVVVTRQPGMMPWRKVLFAWMTRNAQGAALFFRLPPGRVVEVGAQIEL